jgi:hypothetical protein
MKIIGIVLMYIVNFYFVVPVFPIATLVAKRVLFGWTSPLEILQLTVFAFLGVKGLNIHHKTSDVV